MTSPILFCVFSYNRGQYLDNCVDSIARCAPGAEVVIFDDRSNDPETVRILERLSARYQVVSSTHDPGHKHGGLYANMQAALESVAGDRLICFTQDDSQMVRGLGPDDLRFIEGCFAKRPEMGFLSPAFVGQIMLRRIDPGAFAYDPEIGLFFRTDARRSAGIYYSDIFLSTSGRLRDAGWSFARGEPANQNQARSRFCPMGYMTAPFLMWLPNGTAYRGKTKTMALRFAERIRRCGFYPFETMTEDEVRAMEAAIPPKLPVAEDFLRTIGETPRKPWIYNPMQGARMLQHLNRLELLARAAFR